MGRLAFSSVVLGFVSLSCAAGADDASGGSGGAGVTSTTSEVTTTATGSTVSTGTFGTGSSGTGGDMQIAEVFGHSKSTLYKLNPDTKAVGVVGDFVGCSSSVVDIALDKNSNLYATADDGLYTVDKVTAQCTNIVHAAQGVFPNSLSFVPAGTVDPNDETLVGYVLNPPNTGKNQYVRIDTVTGAISNIGAPWTDDFVTSGDIVSVKDGPTYLTVKKGGLCDDNDCLVEINPQTGALVKNYGVISGYTKVFGLSFWAGSVYGFSNAGDLFEVKIMGNALITTPIDTPEGLSFWGAGSTTSAPPVPQ